MQSDFLLQNPFPGFLHSEISKIITLTIKFGEPPQKNHIGLLEPFHHSARIGARISKRRIRETKKNKGHQKHRQAGMEEWAVGLVWVTSHTFPLSDKLGVRYTEYDLV